MVIFMCQFAGLVTPLILCKTSIWCAMWSRATILITWPMKDQMQCQTTHYSTLIIVIITGVSCLGNINIVSPINSNNYYNLMLFTYNYILIKQPVKHQILICAHWSDHTVKLMHTFSIQPNYHQWVLEVAKEKLHILWIINIINSESLVATVYCSLVEVHC